MIDKVFFLVRGVSVCCIRFLSALDRFCVFRFIARHLLYTTERAIWVFWRRREYTTFALPQNNSQQRLTVDRDNREICLIVNFTEQS